jgi:hypothetical protein
MLTEQQRREAMIEFWDKKDRIKRKATVTEVFMRFGL